MKKRGRKTKKKKVSKNRTVASTRSEDPPTHKGKKSLAGKQTAEAAAISISKMPNEKRIGKDVSVSTPGVISKFRQFFRESKKELNRVKWPTRKELFTSTTVVIVLSLMVAFFLGLVDFGLIKMIKGLVG
jgi:preprotein translocase subunit SecE